MSPDDEVCLCFHVTLRKIRAYLKREDPPVASLISTVVRSNRAEAIWLASARFQIRS